MSSQETDVAKVPAWTAQLIADKRGIDPSHAKQVLEFGVTVGELRRSECKDGTVVYWSNSST